MDLRQGVSRGEQRPQTIDKVRDRRDKKQKTAEQEALAGNIAKQERSAESLRSARKKAEEAGRTQESAAIAKQERKTQAEIKKLKHELLGPDRANYVDSALASLQQEDALSAYFGHTPDTAGYNAFKQRLEILNKNINELDEFVDTQEQAHAGLLGGMRLRFNKEYQTSKENLAKLREEYDRVLDVNQEIEDRISHLIAIEGSSDAELEETVDEEQDIASTETDVEAEPGAQGAEIFQLPLTEQPPSKRRRRFGILAGAGAYLGTLLARQERAGNEAPATVTEEDENGKRESRVLSGIAKNRRMIAAVALVGLVTGVASKMRERISLGDEALAESIENAETLTDAERAALAVVESLPDGTQRILIPNEQGEFEGPSTTTHVPGESFVGDRDFYQFDLADYKGAGGLTTESAQNLAFDVQHWTSVGTVRMMSALENAVPGLDPSLIESITIPDLAFGDELASPEGDWRNLEQTTTMPRMADVMEAGVLDGLVAYGVDTSNMEIVYGTARENLRNLPEIFESAKRLKLIDSVPDEADQQEVLNKITSAIRKQNNELRKKYEGNPDAQAIVDLLNQSRGVDGIAVTMRASEVVEFGTPTEAEKEAVPDLEQDTPEVWAEIIVVLPEQAPVAVTVDSALDIDEAERMLALAKQENEEPNRDWRAQQESALEEIVNADEVIPGTFRDAKDGKLDLIKLERYILKWVGETDANGRPEALFKHAIGLDPSVKEDILTGILDLMDDKDLAPEAVSRIETYFDLLMLDLRKIEELPAYIKNNKALLHEFVQMMAHELKMEEFNDFNAEDSDILLQAISELQDQSGVDVTSLNLIKEELIQDRTS